MRCLALENWLQKLGLTFDTTSIRRHEEKLVNRMFVYPKSENFEEEITIDYHKFINYLEANENVYFDEFYGKRIPILDILKHIGEANARVTKQWKGTDYITKAKILNFKIFENIEIKFSRNINILLGNNGLGKTSLLQAITLGLLPIDNNDLPDDLPEYIRFNCDKSEITIHWEEENRKLFIFPHGKPAEEEPIYPNPRLLLSYGVSFNTNKEQDHTKIVNELVEGTSELYFTKSIFEEYYKNLYDPLIILKYLDDKRTSNSNQNDIFKSINELIKSTLNDFLALVDESKRIEIKYDEEKQRYYFYDFYQTKIELHQLSEGYKDHILLLTDIIVRILASRTSLLSEKETTIDENFFRNIHAVILIDEFDRHLHPSWQRNLLSKFKEDFPNVQFILTTHNPMSIIDREGNEIIELKQDESGKIAPFIHSEGTKYLDISRVYLKYFVNDIVSKELHEDIEKYNTLFLANKTETSEFKIVEKKLKDANIGYAINDVRYWKFLKFLQKYPQLDPVQNPQQTGEWEFTDEDWNELLNELK